MAISASSTTSTDPAPRGGSDYSQLMARVRAEGLLERSVRNYLLRFAALAVLFAGGLVLLVTVGSSWWQLAVAAYWAVVFAQLGFLGHDAGHQQIFPSRRRNDRLGLWLSNLVLGLSYSWWIDKHNRHHRHPNDVERDPDVARNVIAWTPAQARLQRGALKFVARHQAALFFPFLVFEAINLHVGSVRSLLAQPRRQWTELALLAAHVTIVAVVLLSRDVAVAGAGVRGRAPGVARALPRRQLRAEPQGDAGARGGQRVGLPASAGADLPERHRWTASSPWRSAG